MIVYNRTYQGGEESYVKLIEEDDIDDKEEEEEEEEEDDIDEEEEEEEADEEACTQNQEFATALERVLAEAAKIRAEKASACVPKTGLKTSFKNIVRAAATSVNPNSSLSSIITAALKGAQRAVQDAGGPEKIDLPRIIHVDTKIGGGFLRFLVPLFAGLSATGALAGGAAGVVKAANDAKTAKQQFEESQRHNKMMKAITLGKGLYLRPYKSGMGLYLRPYIGRGLPDRALTDFDLVEQARDMKIPNFRGVFMRDTLPKNGPRYRESAIVNLDGKDGTGTHWVAYRKRGDKVTYFDSFGDLQPPTDLMEYFGYNTLVKYNHKRYQDFNSYNCGHLCLKFLNNTLK